MQFSFLILIGLCVTSAYAQEKVTLPLAEDSYISYGAHDNVLFEGQIAPNYPVIQWGGATDEFSGSISLVPKIILKMYTSESNPVKTPSYMPRIIFQGLWQSGTLNLYPYTILSHHSNGQNGETIIYNEKSATDYSQPARKLNTENGSFSTNYIQSGYYISLSSHSKHLVGASYEYHPAHGVFSIDKNIAGIYGRKRIHYDYRYAGDLLQIDLNYTKILDRITDLDGKPPSRIFSATAKVKLPKMKNMVWLFANYYRGQDYYNIQFLHEIAQFKIGLAIHTKLMVE